MGEEREDHEIPSERLHFSLGRHLVGCLSEEDQEQVRVRLAELSRRLRWGTEGHEPQD